MVKKKQITIHILRVNSENPKGLIGTGSKSKKTKTDFSTNATFYNHVDVQRAASVYEPIKHLLTQTAERKCATSLRKYISISELLPVHRPKLL